jgi:hypothetical protein
MLKRFAFFIIMCCTSQVLAAQSQEKEANLKAVFIYNFINYIDWGNEENGNEFVIGIIGSSEIDNPLAAIAKTNLAKNKTIVIRHFNKVEDIRNCQILFIPKNSPFSLKAVLEKIERGMLTVSDEPGVAKQGAAFNFVLVNGKLKFEVNLKSVYLSGVKVSSQLLKLAIIVD